MFMFGLMLSANIFWDTVWTSLNPRLPGRTAHPRQRRSNKRRALPVTTGKLVQNKQKKLAEPFVSKAAWTTDYDHARAEARKTGKPIFAYFTRS